jgi:hypothetical protein
MIFVVPKSGTTPPGEMEGACAASGATLAREALKSLAPETSLVRLNPLPPGNSSIWELAGFRFAPEAFTNCSGPPSGTPATMVAAEALVSIAMAEPVAAA